MNAAGPSASQPVDSLGCLATSLDADQELSGGGIRFYRKRSDDVDTRPVETPASDRGYLIGLSLRDGHRRRIHGSRASTAHAFEVDSVYVRNFADRYRAELDGAFDFLLVELPHATLARLADEEGLGRIDGLNVATAQRDPLLAALLRALLPALERPAEATPLLLDHLGMAIGACVAAAYGERAMPGSTRRRRLSRQLETRAKDMLRSHLDGQLSVADVADACGLSRSHFTQAFRETVGVTPHQWLVAERIARAKELLATSTLALAEIAAACGFADQSHFTRMFARATGLPPARWRLAR